MYECINIGLKLKAVIHKYFEGIYPTLSIDVFAVLSALFE